MNTFADTPEVKWSSFMPALMKAVAGSQGEILEIGIGHFSTPILHEIGEITGRLVLSVEDNKEWMEPFANRYASEKHQFYYGNYDKNLKMIASWCDPIVKMGVTFIDNSPGGERRKKDFAMFLPLSEYVVVHDFHRENEEAIRPLLEGVNYRVFRDYDPPTLIASLIHPL